MKPVPDYQRITNDLFVWHAFNPECKTDCWSTAVRTPQGFVLIDPIRLEEQAMARMVGDDRVAAVLLTSGNHLRGSLYEMERLDIPLYAPEGAQGEVRAAHWIRDGEVVHDTLKAVGLPGGGPGETAYLAPGVLIVGDALVNLSGLEVLPDEYCANPRTLRSVLVNLASLHFDVLCFAHGSPIVEGARKQVEELVRRAA